MNDPTPLTAEQIDELLSAELDGEFDAAAHDLGYTPAAARAELHATDGVEARRRALAEARDTLAVQPEFDELLESRLQAKALNAWAEQRDEQQSLRRASRRRHTYALTGALAAAITAVVVIAAVARDPSNNDDASTARAETSAPAADGPRTPQASLNVDFGEVPDVATLVKRASETPTDPVPAAGGGVTSESDNTSFRVTDGGELAPATDVNTLKRAGRSCADAAQQASRLPSPSLRGSATVSGEPIYVFVYRTDAQELVIVLDEACNLVSQRTGPPRTG
jgi:hypothetical protein